MPKVEQNRVLKTIGIVLFALLLVVLGLKLDSYQKELEIANNNGSQVSELLYGENRAPGFSCGVLTESKAEGFLEVNLDRNFVQGPVNLATENSLQNLAFWADNCRYADPNDSNKYVELLINSYQSEAEAARAFPLIFNIVNDKVEMSVDGLGDRLAYDKGVHYLLRGSRIIQVAASNGDTSNIEHFSHSVFRELISNMSLK